MAKLHVVEDDWPWVRARVERCDGFDLIEPLFREEVRLLDELADVETAEWTAAYQRIRNATSLAAPGGHEVPEYLLHIDGDAAWWRWEDQPFPVDGG